MAPSQPSFAERKSAVFSNYVDSENGLA